MFFEEIKATEAYNLSPHRHTFINPYNGCSMGCPFCYWLSQEGWEGRIQIKTNIADLLERELRTWPKEEFLYLGSVCDPFNEAEEKYRLSRQCLELIKKYRIPLVITTSAVNPAILEYIELLLSMTQRVVTVVELARIPFIEEMNRGKEHRGITHANACCEAGLETWATLAPILPGITDLKKVLAALDSRIPVYIDRLNCTLESVQGTRTLKWIREDYPGLAGRYEDMMAGQDWGYLDEILKSSSVDGRIKTFPFQLDDAQKKRL